VREAEDPDRILLTVRDTGIGIAQENLEHIFEEFRQVDQTLAKKYAGTGLGLAITRSLVQLMQGTITVESELGRGSTFLIELPRQVPASAQTLSPPEDGKKSPEATSLDSSILSQKLKGSRTGRQLY
jgi:signal transduction histidine kinase